MMDRVKETLEKFKGFYGTLSNKAKKILIATAILVVIGAVIIAAFLNHKNYAVLFSGITSEESTEILAKLSELQVEYKYSGNGEILVDSKVVDSTRATLAYEGYPKSGFTYDIFISNSGSLTTDSESQTYKLYDLQNRIGATIRLFEGVKDARVTIALGNEQKYVLDKAASKPSASVTVITKAGHTVTQKQAEGIQRLVAHSVPEMEMDSVVVLDETGVEVSSTNEASTSGDVGEAIAQIVEGQITKKVWNVLEPFYGAENIRISSNVKINMEKIIRETITYTTPDKIDKEDKDGIISHETIDTEAAGVDSASGGVVGTEQNSDISQYVADALGDDDGYYSNIIDRNYLVNQIKEQGELAAGAIEDQTISVSLNLKEGQIEVLEMNKLYELIGNAAGIPADQWEKKIAVASAPFYSTDEGHVPSPGSIFDSEYFLYILAGCAALLIIIIVVITVLIRNAKKKKSESEETETPVMFMMDEEALKNEKQEILQMKNERSKGLRENIRDFAEENPEIAATMLKQWLHGGDDSGNV